LHTLNLTLRLFLQCLIHCILVLQSEAGAMLLIFTQFYRVITIYSVPVHFLLSLI